MRLLSLSLAVVALFPSASMPEAQARESLALLKQYDLGASRYSEGLDCHDGFLWHTTFDSLYKLDLDSARDTDGDGDYDLTAERTWLFTHHNHSESSVWLNGELFNFTFTDTSGNLSDDIYRLDLNDDETYQWQHVGDGEGATNWGSCRDKRTPGEFIIYTGHYDDLLMWYDPDTGTTTRTLEIPGLDDIEDLGMDLYGTVWASSYNSGGYPGLYRIDPDTGEVLETFDGPSGLDIIDGVAIRSVGDHDVMYVTGKNTQYIWEYQTPEPASAGLSDVDLVSGTLEVYPNHPNPFNPSTSVSFLLGSDAEVSLSIFNALGQKVRTLEVGSRHSGRNSAFWNGTNDAGEPVGSGVYLFTVAVKIGDRKFDKTTKGILVR